VDGRVDPATTLRHENLEVVGGDGLSLGEAGELELVLREVLENDGGEVAIFSEREEVLKWRGGSAKSRKKGEGMETHLDMKRLDLVLTVLRDNGVGDEDGLVLEGAETVH
jgi:hypothetical protein